MEKTRTMEKTRPRGKIPRTEWGAIAARHATGESLARIARDYDCTAPAIRYIVRQESASAAKAEGARGAPQTPREDRGVESPPAAAAADSGLDFRLRAAITVEISAFLVALDDAMGEGKTEALQRLREATDRLLRAAARIRIELERPLGEPRKPGSAAAPRP
jgi:transposase-like protein